MMEVEEDSSHRNTNSNIERCQAFWKRVYIRHFHKYLDLAFLSLAIPSSMYAADMYIHGGVSLHPDADKLSENGKANLRKIPYLMATIIIVILWSFAAWVSVNLLKTVEAELERNDALKVVRFFRNLNVALVVCGLVDLYFCKSLAVCGFSLMWFLLLVCIARQSAERLNVSVSDEENGNANEMQRLQPEPEHNPDAIWIQIDEAV